MKSTAASSVPVTQYIERPDGKIAYDLQGAGPLVILVPGMGDLRSSYRSLTPALVAAGYTVATTDLRGHGDSDATFGSYGDNETASDIHALIEHLGGPAVIVGNSMAAGAGVIVAADHASAVAGLVLVGPFVRNSPANAFTRSMYRVLMTPAWIAPMWKAYMPTLYAGAKPADFKAYRASVVASIRRPGYRKAFSQTTAQLDHSQAEVKLSAAKAPALIVMGDRDPDFKDPAAEATWIGDTLNGEVVMIAEAGHIPQSQQPQAMADAVVPFLKRVHRG